MGVTDQRRHPRPYLRLLRLVWTTDRTRTTVLAVCVVLGSAAPVVFAVAAAIVVAQVPRAVEQGGLGSAAGERLLLALVVMGTAFAVQQVLPAVRQTVGDSLGRRFTARTHRRLMAAALRPRGIGHLEDPAIADRLAAGRRGVSGWPRPGDAVAALAGRATLHLTVWSGALLLVVFHWWAAAVVLAAAVLLQRRLSTVMGRLGESQAGSAAALREPAYLSALALRPGAGKEVRLFGLGGWLVSRHAAAWAAASDSLVSERRQDQRSLLSAVAAMCAAIVLVLGVLAWEVTGGAIGLAAVAVTAQAIALVPRTITDENAVRDGMVLGYALAALRAADELDASLTTPPDRPGGASAADLPRQEIRVEDVHFTYPGSTTPVLCGLDLTIPAGTSLGIVGLNGAGKTTLIKLLCRLYEPTAGRILVDGTDVRDLDPRAWQQRVAAIFQDYVQYPFTAADNVTLGRPDPPALDGAAAAVGLEPIIAGLPHGWDSTLSHSSAGGVDLSGGQWQRLALARALFRARAGAAVLILDEPTANLDVRGEIEVYDRFLELTQGFTTILISHRLSSVRRADRVAVIGDGRLVEIGSHDDLITRGGRYAELFALQASSFRTAAGAS
jgi:ATP-binding cassette subfamily B protein